MCLFWHLEQELKDNALKGQKAEYGKSIVINMGRELELGYECSYENCSVLG